MPHAALLFALLLSAPTEAKRAGHPDVGEEDSHGPLWSGDRVKVTSRRGSETFRARLVPGARPGLVFVHMHDPDRMCNRITIDAVDPISKQPEFKVCAVKLEKAGEARR